MINYQDYYEKQSGSGLPIFYGSKHQKGYGLGNIFRSFYRWIAPVFKTHALPLLKEGAKVLGTEAVSTMADVANDTLEGNSFKESFKNRSKDAINTLADKARKSLQKGQGYKRNKHRLKTSHLKNSSKPTKRKSNSKKAISKKPRTKEDIFDLL